LRFAKAASAVAAETGPLAERALMQVLAEHFERLADIAESSMETSVESVRAELFKAHVF